MTAPVSSPDAARRNDVMLAILAWWGGFFTGPVLAAVFWLTTPTSSLLRAHGRGATAVFASALVFYAPITVAVMIFGVGDPAIFYVAWALFVCITVGSCILGTVQARRRRTPLGRSLPNTPSTSTPGG